MKLKQKILSLTKMKNKFLMAILLAFQMGCTIEKLEFDEAHFRYKSLDSALIDVTPRLWNCGCANTAAGMLVEYWGSLGYKVYDNQSDIVSDYHVKYYYNPIDSVEELLPDSSILDNPRKTCLADYMKSSWYSAHCNAGATGWFNILPGLKKYAESKHNYFTIEGYDIYSYEQFTSIIDEGNPVFMAVAPYGDNRKHAILAIGYTKQDTSFYCYDTWSETPRKLKYNVRSLAKKNDSWIIGGLMDLKNLQNINDPWVIVGLMDLRIDLK